MAMRASGVSMAKTVTPLIVAVLLLCGVTYVISDRVASSTHYVYRKLIAQIGIENPTAALEEGTFIKKFKNFVIFIYEIDKTKLRGIRIYQPQEGKPTRTIIAQKGEVISIPEENVIKLRLMHGTSDEPDPKDPSKLYKLNFRTYDLPLNVSEFKTSDIPEKKPKDMTVAELRAEIERLGEAGIKATYPLSAEIHNKIALSFSSLAFFLIGVPLGITTRRSEKSIGFGISIALMACYWTMLIGGKAVAQKGVANPFLALEAANFLVGGIGLIMFWRRLKK
jgi:lipopolysaccharide export LptBFGC system permease protein LptF